ncbi:hypothetical protein F7725_027062 [Dissostichus mawsoni]|uniref:G-protein coupled receptors family 1 profile domain-containing protein n=1 Tax=Dissostichus mawsoni TaxID=36200 RepID=A0A7J5XBX3_DISMA|nr:hypothetical protein F7725_027062 [Dissostichus mawsoni]
MFASTVILLSSNSILFSYMRILRVCFSGRKQSRQKAAHLTSLSSSTSLKNCKILQASVPNIGLYFRPNMLRPQVLGVYRGCVFKVHAPMRPKLTGHVPGPPETNISKFQNSVQSSLPGKGVIEPGLTSDLECPFLGQSQPDPHHSPGVKGANMLLIVVICVNRSLHEPMYLFLCSLFVNELYGSTGLFPFLLVQILSDIHTVSAPLCFLQIYSVYTYVCVEYSNLTVMSYDRYLAICYPLQYNTYMTSNKAYFLITVSWLFPFLAIVVLISLSVSLQLCGNILNTVGCGNYSIVKLACSDTRVNNIYGLFYTVISIIIPLLLILYTYMRILRVCFSGSKQTRQKALSTCTPHLASLLNFFFGAFFQILQSRFDMSSVPNMLRVLLSLYFLTCQPLFTPVLYGLKMSKIRIICKQGGSLKDDVSELQTEGKSSSSEFQLSEESSTSHTLDLCIIHINIGRSVWIICLMYSHDEEHVHTVIAMFKVTSKSR